MSTEKIIIDWTKPVEYFCGHDVRPVRVLCTDGPNEKYPIVVWIEGKGMPETATIDGRLFLNCPVRFRNVTPKKHVRYINLYLRFGLMFCPHETREIADKYADPDRIACIRVEFTEGQFDD